MNKGAGVPIQETGVIDSTVFNVLYVPRAGTIAMVPRFAFPTLQDAREAAEGWWRESSFGENVASGECIQIWRLGEHLPGQLATYNGGQWSDQSPDRFALR